MALDPGSSTSHPPLCVSRPIYLCMSCFANSCSSVDTETEAIMQQIIDADFKDAGCTVLAVMHRLEHIRRYDKVALLGDGKLLEYGEPEELLAGETTELARLYSYYRG